MMGSQSMEIRYTDPAYHFTIDALRAPYVDPSGETTSITSVSHTPASAGNRFYAYMWFRFPDSPVISQAVGAEPGMPNAGALMAIQPGSDGDRQAWIQLVNDDNTINGKPAVFTDAAHNLSNWPDLLVASGLSWGQWYRFDIDIQSIDGLQTNGDANDILTVTVRDSGLNVMGSTLATTWEVPRWLGMWGTSPAGPRALNGFDFRSRTRNIDQLMGYVDLTWYGNPEPTSMILLAGAAGLGALRRRRP